MHSVWVVGRETWCVTLEKRSIRPVGVDFLEGMIQISKESTKREGLELADFICSSMYDYDFNHSKD